MKWDFYAAFYLFEEIIKFKVLLNLKDVDKITSMGAATEGVDSEIWITSLSTDSKKNQIFWSEINAAHV